MFFGDIVSSSRVKTSLVEDIDGDEFVAWISQAAGVEPAPLDAPSQRAITEFFGHFQSAMKFSVTESESLLAAPFFAAYRPFIEPGFLRLVQATNGSVDEARTWLATPVDPNASTDRIAADVDDRVRPQCTSLSQLVAWTEMLFILIARGGPTERDPATLRAQLGRWYVLLMVNGLAFEKFYDNERLGLRNVIMDYITEDELARCKNAHQQEAKKLREVLPELGWEQPVRHALVHFAIAQVVERWRQHASALRRTADASLLLSVRIGAQATHDDTVLLLGETGTGKEFAARAIHELGARAKGPFKVINCGAIPEGLAEAELHGIAKGVASGVVEKAGFLEEAQGGTLFLDEINKAPLAFQGALLRVMGSKVRRQVGTTTEQRVDVRFIAACNKDLLAAIREREFLEDLYYRLNPDFAVRLPPLRERSLNDFCELWNELIDANLPASLKAAASSDAGAAALRLVAISQAASLFSQREWPGNIRQLESFARFFVHSTRGHGGFVTTPEMLALLPQTTRPEWPAAPMVTSVVNALGQMSLDEAMDSLSTIVIDRVVAEEGGIEPAAKRLGLSHEALKKRRQRLAPKKKSR